MNNILNINFEEGKIIAKVGGLWQWDKGQKIRVFGTGITQDAEIHFSLMEKGGSSVTLTGTYDSSLDALIADIPDRYLGQDSLIDYKLYAFIYVRSDESSAETIYKIIMTVKARPKPDGYDAAVVPSAPYIVEFDTVGSGDSALCTCRQTYADVIDALASGRSVMAVEYRYSQSTDDDPYQTRYHCLIGVGTSQIKFGENGLTFMSNRDPAYGDAWMITAPYIILKSNGTVVRISATSSPAMMGDINALTSAVNAKADKMHVTITKIAGDNPSNPTADKTYEQIMAAVQEGAEIICTYTVQLVYGGEIEQETTQHLQFVRADEYNIHFGFCGWGLQMGKYRLSAHAIDISAYNDITVYNSSVEIATAANITTLTSRISQLEARVAALEGGNG